MPYCEESPVAKLDPEGASQFLSAQPYHKEDTTLFHEGADFVSEVGISDDSTKDCSSGTSASKIPTEDTHDKLDSVSDINTETPADHGNMQISECPEIQESSPLPQREGTLECDTVPSVKAEANELDEPGTSPIQVRRSTRSTRGKPPNRFGSIVSHRGSVHSKLGKWLNSISKKIDSMTWSCV